MADQGLVDVQAMLHQLQDAEHALVAEIDNDKQAIAAHTADMRRDVDVKRARLRKVRAAIKDIEAAADPNLEPARRPGRKSKDEAEAVPA